MAAFTCPECGIRVVDTRRLVCPECGWDIVKAESKGQRAESRKNKFNAKSCEFQGEKFDSILERDRWLMLLDEERSGQISSLKRQVLYRFEVDGVYIGRYTADFVYERGGELVVEDAKGYRPRGWGRQKKLMKACFGIAVREWPERSRKRRVES